jgi:hypothetical protein
MSGTGFVKAAGNRKKTLKISPLNPVAPNALSLLTESFTCCAEVAAHRVRGPVSNTV